MAKRKVEPRHGDPFDYPDIPGESGLGDEYAEATTSPAVKEAIAKRRAERRSMRHQADA